MNEEIIPASGERAAMGGYLPQFDEFAWFVYLNLINNKLEWIRVADPKAEKLDDIQYATYSEIHAYQVKWTIADANISFSNFLGLIPLITSSWKTLKANNPGKKVIPHLITNKPISFHDNLKKGASKIGSFGDFISEAWSKLRTSQPVDAKWNPFIAKLKKASKLRDSEFKEFISLFDFQPNYKKKQFSIRNVRYFKEEDDLQKISRFIIEKVAGSERGVQFNRQDIIKELGWIDRFKTLFNHELVIDRQRYQPIQSTIDKLNIKLTEHTNGYLFLLGGPGAGKSTLLNEWSKGLKARVVKYYAFDFVNPSSNLNYYERGNATHLFFDLVFQLKEVGIYKRDILPYKDLLFLKEVFNEQLNAIGHDFATTGQPTIIIIDGLDHVPREYKSTTNSFLRELPVPSSLPDGVFIILGSQSYDLEDLQQEIKSEFLKGDRTIPIDPLNKEEVYKYLSNIDSSIKLKDNQKLRIFEKSQGHPLYLSYFIENIIKSETIDSTIDSFEIINGSIDTYYKKIWEPILHDESLIHFLGLVSRINGSVNLNFVKEWNIERCVLKSFKSKARLLFNEEKNSLSFFHNSFKQFLLYHTSLNYLTDEFDEDENINYHKQLSDYYRHSKVENTWKRNYHLFQAKQYEEFISVVTPESLTAQLIDFRPVEDIKQDAKLGIEIAKQTKDVVTLLKYLFSLAEIERRLFNIDPASFTEELLKLDKFDNARDYLRTGNILHCSNSYAYKAVRLFIQYGHKSEASALYNLAYPEIITDGGIIINDSHRYEEVRDTLMEWTYTAPFFETTQNILSIIDSIKFSADAKLNRFEEKRPDLVLRLLSNLAYSLVDQDKWDDVDIVLSKIKKNTPIGKSTYFYIIEYSINQCLDSKDTSRANEYLKLLTKYFKKDKTNSTSKIYIADFVYKITKDLDETYSWISEIEPLTITRKDDLGYDGSLDPFITLIKLNKLLNLCGKGVGVTTAVPAAPKGTDEEVLVEFKRMLCLSTQIYTDAILKKQVAVAITRRVLPIVRFYYKNVSHKNNYWYKLKQSKGQYLDFLISAVSEYGAESINTLGDFFFSEFHETPKYWNSKIQRQIIDALLKYGFNADKAKTELNRIEDNMLDNLDIDGRISECLAHSKVWFTLGESKTAEKWLKQSIKESIGVGYRKDYQFSTWIDWLRKINFKDPMNATERIQWFLSNLNHIKETTEGRAYWDASEELLDASYEHNLNDGLEQSIWQLENDLIDFKDSISLFIKHFVKRTENEEELKSIIQLYCGLYLLLAESTNAYLLKAILDKGYEILKEKFFYENLHEIILAIDVRAYEESRHYLLIEIEDFCLRYGKKITDYYLSFKVPDKTNRYNSSGSSNTLVLKKDHESISEKTVLERVTTFDNFKDILQKEDQVNSYFIWSKVIDKVAPFLTTIQISEIANIAKVGSRGSAFFADLSELAFVKGDKDLAESLANKSLELSSESGWIKHYDGGTRLNAFRALTKVNPSASYDRAFEIFAQDILNGNYPSSYIGELEEIIPLLSKDYVVEEIWPEIFGYLRRLMSNSKPITDLPSFRSIKKPILETLVDYTISLIKNPISLIKEQAVLLLSKLINQNNDYALTLLLGNSLDEYITMDVVMTLRELNSSKISKLKHKIQNLALSKDFLIRENAKLILTELNEDIPIAKTIVLPTIYTLSLPESQKLLLDKETDPYFPEINLNNPSDLIKPFESLINILSKESGIDEPNLIYRTHILMKEIGKEEEWTLEYEKKLRNHLEEIYLKYPYRRPRVIAARKAIMQVTTELIDAGIIDGEGLINVFTDHDYSIPHFIEVTKPHFIQSLHEREYGGVGNDWINRINESERLAEINLLSYNKSQKIIAEYYQVTNLDWGSPTEEYMYQIAVNEKVDKKGTHIFGSLFHHLSCDYHYVKGGGHSIIVIRDHRFDQFDIKSNWIAINPALAIHLGWQPEPSKLFAWRDSNDKLMAESIFWSNGNVQMTPRKDAEVGEGWLVIVSEEGFKQINSLEKDLYLQKKIVRTKYEDSNLKTNEIFKVTRI